MTCFDTLDYDCIVLIFHVLYLVCDDPRAALYLAYACKRLRTVLAFDNAEMLTDCMDKLKTHIVPRNLGQYAYTAQRRLEATSRRRINGLTEVVSRPGITCYSECCAATRRRLNRHNATLPTARRVLSSVLDTSVRFVEVANAAPFCFLYKRERITESMPRPRGDESATHRHVIVKVQLDEVDPIGADNQMKTVFKTASVLAGMETHERRLDACELKMYPSPDGRIVVYKITYASSKACLFGVDTANGENNEICGPGQTLPKSTAPRTIWWTSDNRLRVYWQHRGVFEYGIHAKAETPVRIKENTTVLDNFHIAGSGDTLVCIYSEFICHGLGNYDHTLFVFDLARDGVHRHFDVTHTFRSNSLYAHTSTLGIQLSPNGQFVGVVTSNGTLTLVGIRFHLIELKPDNSIKTTQCNMDGPSNTNWNVNFSTCSLYASVDTLPFPVTPSNDTPATFHMLLSSKKGLRIGKPIEGAHVRRLVWHERGVIYKDHKSVVLVQ